MPSSVTEADVRAAVASIVREPFLVDDVLLALELPRAVWGTRVWHILRDMMGEGLIVHTERGYWHASNQESKP